MSESTTPSSGDDQERDEGLEPLSDDSLEDMAGGWAETSHEPVSPTQDS